MTSSTLKLPAKADQAIPAESTKPPVRRTDPAKRSRSAAPVKAPVREDSAAKGAQSEARQPAGKTNRPGADTHRNNEPAAQARSQRNHRFDGKPHETDPRQPKKAPPFNAQAPDSRAPAGRTIQRGEFKRDEFNRNQPKNTGPGRDTPRRGGKARDGFEQGDFNKNRATNPMFTPKPAASQPELPRLSKRMAELGLCSRREADEWISNGWVSVDGVVMDTLGTRISPDAKIEVSDAARKHQSENVTILLHKPIGYVSGQAEDGYQPAIVLISPENQWQEEGKQRDPTQPQFKRGHLQGLAPAGRLDIDSTGLLVLTQDGRVARQLIGEDSTVEKEYLVRVEGELSAAGLKLLNHGLELDGVKLKPAKVSWQNEDQLRFVLREGRKRQIRRMCELVGLTVTGLKRVRIGSVSLGKLPLGTWRYLKLGERF